MDELSSFDYVYTFIVMMYYYSERTGLHLITFIEYLTHIAVSSSIVLKQWPPNICWWGSICTEDIWVYWQAVIKFIIFDSPSIFRDNLLKLSFSRIWLISFKAFLFLSEFCCGENWGRGRIKLLRMTMSCFNLDSIHSLSEWKSTIWGSWYWAWRF